MEWQPIETAPKDGTPVLAYGYSPHYPDEYFTRIQWWADGIGYWAAHSVSIIPTHWMPLPDPPKGTDRAEAARVAELEGVL